MLTSSMSKAGSKAKRDFGSFTKDVGSGSFKKASNETLPTSESDPADEEVPIPVSKKSSVASHRNGSTIGNPPVDF
jgi:hypothetical protein